MIGSNKTRKSDINNLIKIKRANFAQRRIIKMNLLDFITENYDLTEPQNLRDDEISVLLTDITAELEVSKVGENLQTLENAEKYAKVSAFLSECKKRTLFDGSEITKFEEFLLPLKTLKEKPNFQCQFCSVSFSRNDSLKLHIDSVHNGIRHRLSVIKKNIRFSQNPLTPTCTSVFQNTETKNIFGKCHFGRRNIGTDPR